MNIFEKLSKARLEFHQLELKKSGHNKFAGYRYFELGDFLIPALKVFDRNRLCPVISFDATAALMTITDLDDPAQSIKIGSPMAEAQLKGCHPVQNLGASQTYLRRYLWTAALEIVEHDAVDAAEAAEEPAQSPALGVMMNALAALDGWPLLKLQAEDESGFRSAFGRLNSKQKTLHRELEQAAAQARVEYRDSLNEAFSNEDATGATQLIDELTTPERKQLVWAVLEQPVKAWLKKIKEEM